MGFIQVGFLWLWAHHPQQDTAGFDSLSATLLPTPAGSVPRSSRYGLSVCCRGERGQAIVSLLATPCCFFSLLGQVSQTVKPLISESSIWRILWGEINCLSMLSSRLLSNPSFLLHPHCAQPVRSVDLILLQKSLLTVSICKNQSVSVGPESSFASISSLSDWENSVRVNTEQNHFLVTGLMYWRHNLEPLAPSLLPSSFFFFPPSSLPLSLFWVSFWWRNSAQLEVILASKSWEPLAVTVSPAGMTSNHHSLH